MNSAHQVFSRQRFAQEDAAPLYLRLKRLVNEAIADGDLRQGDALPSERDIAERLDVSRVTIRKAFAELVDDGVLIQRRGSGTFVRGNARRIEQPLSRLTSFTEDMQLRGLTTDSTWLERSVALPTPEEALRLSISPSDRICRFHRLRRADGLPLAIELAVVPQRFLDDPMAVESSLYAVLAEHGFQPVRALQRLHAVALLHQHAKLLDVPTGSPALFIERVSFLPDGRTVEFTKSYYRGDTYDFVAELSLAPEARP
jgi:GntR family transcriptional regulator